MSNKIRLHLDNGAGFVDFYGNRILALVWTETISGIKPKLPRK
jgi:hypothetical protein